MANLKKSIPKTLASCKCLCCTDCVYYVDENTSMFNCEQKQKLIREQEVKRREQLNKIGILGV